MKKIKIRCLNCGETEIVEEPILLMGVWRCYCNSNLYEVIEESEE